MIYYTSHAPILNKNGYVTTPIRPHSKKPLLYQWTNPRNYNSQSDAYNKCGIGILCGVGDSPVYALDIDIIEKDVVKYIIKYLKKNDLQVICRVGQFPKSLCMFRGEQPNLRKRTSNEYEIGKIECLGLGQQFVAFGIHPTTKKPYSWPNNSILQIPANQLPLIKPDFLDILFKEFHGLMEVYGIPFKIQHIEQTKLPTAKSTTYDPGDPLDVKDPIGISSEELYTLFSHVNPDCSREQWLMIGMAIHHETKGSPEGFKLWDEWSSGGNKYKPQEMEKQWNSFNRSYGGEPITARYLYKLKKKMEESGGSNGKTNFFENIEWSPKRFIDEPPDLEMVIEDMLPKSIVSLVYSAGGAGKSTLLLYLAVKIAASNSYKMDFFNYKLKGGSVVIVTAEDPEIILNKRYIGILTDLAADLNMSLNEIRKEVEQYISIVSTYGHAVPLFKVNAVLGILKPTIHYKHLLTKLQNMTDLSVVIIDTKTRFSPGEGLGNVVATQEINYYEHIVQQTGATVMLLHHSDKKSRIEAIDGAQAFRGATALFDSPRAAFYLRGVNSKEITNYRIPIKDLYKYMVFENTKNNYLLRCPNMLIKRERYAYSGTVMDAPLPKAKLAEMKRVELMDTLLIYMQKQKVVDFSQGELVKVGELYEAGRSRVLSSLNLAIEGGLVLSDDATQGKSKNYRLSELGKEYNLEL